MRELAIMYAAMYAQLVLFAISSWGLARAVGAHVTAIAIGTPAVIPLRRARPIIKLGPFPTASVELLGRGKDEDAADGWYQLGRSPRVLVILGPWALAAGLVVICLGPEHALRSIARGFAQVLVTLDVTPLVRRMLAIAATAPLPTTFGIVLAKLVAMNLLPIGGLAGGGVLQELATHRNGRLPRGIQTWSGISLLVLMLWVLGRFGWALVQIARS